MKAEVILLAEMGARVRLARQARGLTQAALADVLDVQRPWISKVESGTLSPSPGRLRAICQTLDVHPRDLLGL